MSAAPVEALCQGCLRVRTFPSYAAGMEAKCEACSEDMCPCGACRETIARLRSGDFANAGLRCVALEWTAWEGLVRRVPELPLRDGHQGPEMAMFHALGTGRGWEADGDAESGEVQFLVDLNPEDQATIGMQYDRFFDPGPGEMVGGLSAFVWLYPEGEPVPADPEALAARLAGWLRELADKLSPRPVVDLVEKGVAHG